VDTVETAIRDGVAEGAAGGIAIAAQQAGYTAVDFDRAFTDARAEDGRPDFYQAQAQSWLRRMVDAVGGDLGDQLGRMAEAGATDAQLRTQARSAGTGRNVTAVGRFADWAMGTALATGAAAVFSGMNVTQVNWVTAGDGKVCPACQTREDDSPYPLTGAPQPPEHPNCRCSMEPVNTVVRGLFKFGQYLIGKLP
jgi:hypothetical protein